MPQSASPIGGGEATRASFYDIAMKERFEDMTRCERHRNMYMMKAVEYDQGKGLKAAQGSASVGPRSHLMGWNSVDRRHMRPV
jgi:hypothetical protein